MASNQEPRPLAALDQDKQNQLYNLCILSSALKEALLRRNNITYASGDGDAKDEALGDFEKFLCKLAYVCDTQKGGKTMSALVCLKGDNGPEYLLASNIRNEAEMQEAAKNLIGLLEYVTKKPDESDNMSLHKRTLWRILELNFERVCEYLRKLDGFIKDCIEDSQNHEETKDPTFIHKLHVLKHNVDFPLEITSDYERSKFSSDCERFISEAQGIKDEAFQTIMDHRVKDDQADSYVSWRQFRHYLGRMHSYRRSADIIVAMLFEQPGLFQDAKVIPQKSAPRKKVILLPESQDVKKMAKMAFPELRLQDYEAEIDELEQYGLSEHIRWDLSDRKMKTCVHAEANLCSELMRQGKTSADVFWNDTPFIATSKPLCRMCYFFFNSEKNPFRVRSSHLNLYPNWRMPDIYEDDGPKAQEIAEDMMDDIIEQMQEDTRKILKSKQIDWRRNDSRTSTYGISSRGGYSNHGGYYRAPTSNIGLVNRGESSMGSGGAPPTPPRGETDEAWSDVGD